MNKINEIYRCVIIGADAAGLEAAHEMIKLGIRPLIIDLSNEMEQRALSIEYGLRPYFKEPEMSEKINDITGNVQKIKIITDERIWNFAVTRDDIMDVREYRLRTLFKEVVTSMNVQIADNFENIILTKEQDKYHIIALKDGEEYHYDPDLIIVTRRDIAKENGMINHPEKLYYTSMESDFENVYGKPGNLEYFYTHDALLPGGYILIEQLTSSRAHINFRFSNEFTASAEVNSRNYSEWIKDNILITADRLGTASQISDTVVKKKYIYDEKTALSGTAFLLAGDAADMAEPLFGNSYPYILYSGKVAAHVAKSAFESVNFSSDFLSKYDQMLRSTINPVMKSFKAVRDEIFCSTDKLNEFIADINISSDSKNLRFVESMIKYIYKKGLLFEK